MKFRTTSLFSRASLTFFIFALCFFILDAETNAQTAQSYTFTRRLQLGSSGADVKELQKILNSDPETQIAVSGTGSPGQETTYFGALTKKAVIKFQNKYAFEVLTPSGLVVGNGLVGPNTIKKLNSLTNGAVFVPKPSNSPSVSPTLGPTEAVRVRNEEKIDIYSTDTKIAHFQKEAGSLISSAVSARREIKIEEFSALSTNAMPVVNIKRLTARTARPGGQLGVAASGLTAKNNVYFGENYIVRDVAATGEVLLVKIPEIPPGKYSVVVKNENGISNSTYFVVLPERQISVTVSSVSPKTVAFDNTITITGNGFSAKNDIVMSFGILRDVPSTDGKTMTFTVAPEYWRSFTQYRTNKEYPIQFVVVSNNGVSAMSQFNLLF